MAKVVYNACYGGFSLSDEAIRLGRQISGDPMWGGPTFVGEVYEDGAVIEKRHFTNMNHIYDIERTDPVLVQIVEQLGDKASGMCAKLRIEEVPTGSLYRIDEYDGNETVMTQDNYDWKVA